MMVNCISPEKIWKWYQDGKSIDQISYDVWICERNTSEKESRKYVQNVIYMGLLAQKVNAK